MNNLIMLFMLTILCGITYTCGYNYSKHVNNQASLIAQMIVELAHKATALEEKAIQLERDDKLLSLLLKDWDRAKPTFTREVVISSYTSRPEETDSTPFITACNTSVQVGGIAVSRDLFIELGGCGSPLAISGHGGLFVNDTMNKRYTNTVDIWSGDLTAAKKYGRQTAMMIWQ